MADSSLPRLEGPRLGPQNIWSQYRPVYTKSWLTNKASMWCSSLLPSRTNDLLPLQLFLSPTFALSLRVILMSLLLGGLWDYAMGISTHPCPLASGHLLQRVYAHEQDPMPILSYSIYITRSELPPKPRTCVVPRAGVARRANTKERATQWWATESACMSSAPCLRRTGSLEEPTLGQTWSPQWWQHRKTHSSSDTVASVGLSSPQLSQALKHLDTSAGICSLPC